MIQRPTDIFGAKLPLDGLRICISGAVPERQYWGEIPDLDRLILTFVSEFSALVVSYGGQVVHGSQPVLTPVVAEQARRQVRKGAEGSVPLKLFASQLFGQVPEVTLRAAQMAQADVVLTSQIGKGNARDPDTFNQSLTAMRLAMMQQVDIVVAIGGKLHVDTGFNPGVLEELAQARWHEIPCFVIGAFSGAVATLEHPVLEELSTASHFDDKLPMLELATSTDTMDEYVGKLLGHLARHADDWRKSQRVEHPRGTFRTAEVSALPEGDVMTLPRGKLMSLVEVDPKAASTWQSRFAELRRRIEQRDTAGARELLRRDEGSSTADLVGRAE
jgi:SLOG cluster2